MFNFSKNLNTYSILGAYLNKIVHNKFKFSFENSMYFYSLEPYFSKFLYLLNWITCDTLLCSLKSYKILIYLEIVLFLTLKIVHRC